MQSENKRRLSRWAGGYAGFCVALAICAVAAGGAAAAPALTVLRSFKGGSDGADPVAGLIFDSKGYLYGTTASGGFKNVNCPSGCGVVFKLGPEGGVTVLHAFTDGLLRDQSGIDWASPASSVIFDNKGNLHGTTPLGGLDGNTGGCGTVFELSPPWMRGSSRACASPCVAACKLPAALKGPDVTRLRSARAGAIQNSFLYPWIAFPLALRSRPERRRFFARPKGSFDARAARACHALLACEQRARGIGYDDDDDLFRRHGVLRQPGKIHAA